MTARPVEPAELEPLFSSLGGCRRVGLAVSGGADSTALMVLFQRWLAMRAGEGPSATVFTVDHGLRPEAAGEAVAVADRAARLGFPHETLVFRGKKPSANIQAVAREARLELLLDAARRHGLDAILLAHTRDDQAETFLLRLARGSGVTGLAAMAPRRDVDGIALLRPLLDVPKARLVATLRAAGLDWIEDPSNVNAAYARVRMRGLMPVLAGEGLTADRLAETAARMARASDALEEVVDTVLAEAMVHPGGFVGLPLARLLDAHEEISLRALARVLRSVGGSVYSPRLDALEGALAALRDADGAGAAFRRTLAGAVLDLAAGRLWVYREAGRTGLETLPLSPGEETCWDRRFRVRAPEGMRDVLTVRALGTEGRRELGAQGEGLWPHPAIETVPSLWREDCLVAAAGFAFPAGGCGARKGAAFEPVAALASGRMAFGPSALPERQ